MIDLEPVRPAIETIHGDALVNSFFNPNIIAQFSSAKKEGQMSTIRPGDRCADCKHCKIWATDHRKASCSLYDDQGFHPDRPVPFKCIGKVSKAY